MSLLWGRTNDFIVHNMVRRGVSVRVCESMLASACVKLILYLSISNVWDIFWSSSLKCYMWGFCSSKISEILYINLANPIRMIFLLIGKQEQCLINNHRIKITI